MVGKRMLGAKEKGRGKGEKKRKEGGFQKGKEEKRGCVSGGAVLFALGPMFFSSRLTHGVFLSWSSLSLSCCREGGGGGAAEATQL